MFGEFVRMALGVISRPAGPAARGIGFVAATVLAVGLSAAPVAAQQGGGAELAPGVVKQRVGKFAPKLDALVRQAMKDFAVPGVAIGIVDRDGLVYAKGFGVRSLADKRPVDAKTVFQIASVTKSFLSTTLAMAVDEGKLGWDARVADLMPGFTLSDPWVTREFEVQDLVAQRSGLPAYVNDVMGYLGYKDGRRVYELRGVPFASSFRSKFAYTNLPSLIGGMILADRYEVGSWEELVHAELLEPLGMTATSFTMADIAGAANHAEGHRFTTHGAEQIPFNANIPYRLGPGGEMNSNLEDMARWVRFQLAGGVWQGKRLVSEEALDQTRLPRIAIGGNLSYANGWFVSATSRGQLVWHGGSSQGFNAYIGFMPEAGFGVIVLNNLRDQGLPTFSTGLAKWINTQLLDQKGDDGALKVALKQSLDAVAENEAGDQPPADRTPPGDLARFAGSYSSDMLGPARIVADGDRLVLTLEETGAKIAFVPYNNSIFMARMMVSGPMNGVETADEIPIGMSQFILNGDNVYSRVLLDWNDQTTTFWRTGEPREDTPSDGQDPPEGVIVE